MKEEKGLVIVTGAGASRELGLGEPLPLMNDWCAALCEHLDSMAPHLASAAGLEPSMSSQEFEEALGLLIRWQDVRQLAPRFFGLGGVQPNRVDQRIHDHYARETDRVKQVNRGMAESLHSQFGTPRIDENAAAATYRSLLEPLRERFPWVAFATTNYDPSIEIGLNAMGSPAPDTGFERLPARDPVLKPTGLVDRTGSWDRAAVLHLHGSVGWYEKDGQVNEIGPNKEFNETLGAPAVLYPDPDKDPTQSLAVRDLWREFDEALRRASHVLVIGHSLHDPVLVDRLVRADVSTGVTFHKDDATDAKARETAIRDALPAAIATPISFAAPVEFDPEFLDEWLEATG